MEPFQIMRKECWEEVFRHVDDSQDKLNLLRTNSQLEQSFEYEKTGWLFPGVLAVLLKFTEKAVSGDNDLKQVFLKCRLVSNGCCKAIDNYAEHFWDTHFMPPPFILRSGNFRTRRNLVRFLQDIETHPLKRTPILSRLVNTCSILSDDNDTEPKQEDVLKLLQKTGHHLRAFSIYVIVGDDGSTSATMLKNLISSTPRLKRLSIILSAQNQDADENGPTDILHFPNLSELACMEFICRTANPVHERIDLKNTIASISFLSLNCDIWKNEYSEEIVFANLKRLSLYQIEIPGDGEEKMAKLFQKLNAPKLDEMSLWVVDHANNGPMELIEALLRMSMSSSTLDHLKTTGLEEFKKRFPDSQWKADIGNNEAVRHFGGPPEKQLKFYKVD